MKRKDFVACLGVVILLLQSARGDEKKNEIFDLGEIVVTATKTPHLLKDLPGSITVITGEEIEESGATDLAEALENSAGLRINDYGSMGARSTVTIRGSSAGQVLVLVDGRPIASPSVGTANLSLYPVDNIERIEIIRGPYSSLYGADAMGGVINIITKDAPEKPTTEFGLFYGTFDAQIYLNHGAKKGRFGYFVTAGENMSDGDRDHSACDAHHFSAKMNYALNEASKIALSVGYIHQDLDLPGSLTRPSPLASEEDEKEWVDLTYNLGAGEKPSVMAKLFFNRHWLNYKPNYSVHSVTEGNEFGAELQQNLFLNDVNLLTYGVSYKADAVEADEIAGKKEPYTIGFYLQDEIQFNSLPLTIIPGIRYDAPSAYEDRFSPKVSALYKAGKNTNIRASIGNGYRAPTVDDLYWFEDWGGGMGFFGNPDLKPEKSTSWDVGIEHQISSKVLARATYFESEAEDLISWVETPPRSGHYEATNIDKSFTQGVESEIRFQFTPEFSTNLTYTYCDARDKGATYNDKHLRYKPEHKAGCEFAYNGRSGFKANVRVDYTDSTYSDRANTNRLDEYILLSAHISKTIGENAEIFLIGKNLTDEEYQIYDGYPMPGTSVLGGVKIRF